MGNGQGRTAKHVHQVLMVGAKQRLMVKKSMKRLYHFRVRRILFQCGVIEEFDEGRESGVHVGQPEHNHLFQYNQAMRNTRRFPL
jgi:hypothetical protein